MRLAIFSRVGCVYCDKLKLRLVEMHPDVGFDETVLDPRREEEYAALRSSLLARVAPSTQRTFPFVFDVDTGAFLGGCDEVCAMLDLGDVDPGGMDLEEDGEGGGEVTLPQPEQGREQGSEGERQQP